MTPTHADARDSDAQEPVADDAAADVDSGGESEAETVALPDRADIGGDLREGRDPGMMVDLDDTEGTILDGLEAENDADSLDWRNIYQRQPPFQIRVDQSHKKTSCSPEKWENAKKATTPQEYLKFLRRPFAKSRRASDFHPYTGDPLPR